MNAIEITKPTVNDVIITYKDADGNGVDIKGCEHVYNSQHCAMSNDLDSCTYCYACDECKDCNYCMDCVNCTN